MTRYLTLAEVIELHRLVLGRTRGASGIRDLSALESAVAQPRATFGSHELYPDLPTKAAALCFSLVRNHPFTDGNKRVGHAAMEVFLLLNGFELRADVDEQEALMNNLAAGNVDRDAFVNWVKDHTHRVN